MRELNLTVEKREGVGKGTNRRLRTSGDIPAVVYGPETEPIPVKVNYQTLYRLLHGVPLNTLINLDINGDKEPARKVIIRELQKDPVSGDLLHIDFHHISMNKPITVTVPVRTTGIPVGVKNFGGIVEHIRREISISCLPSAIPEEVTIDISELNVGDSLHVADLKLENVNILTEKTSTIATVVAPTVIKEPTPVAAAEGEAVEGEAAEGAAKEGEAKEGEGEAEAKGEVKEETKDEGKKKKEK